MNSGWICPKCGRCYAPNWMMCTYCGKCTEVTTTTTIPPFKVCTCGTNVVCEIHSSKHVGLHQFDNGITIQKNDENLC